MINIYISMNELDFWSVFNNKNLNYFEEKIKYLLLEFGTGLRCNRFIIGNIIEFELSNFIKQNSSFKVKNYPNKDRIDLIINNFELSVKYSSTGNITLHNSNMKINTDTNMNNLLLLTPNKMFLIVNKKLEEFNIDISIFLKNTGDGLQLKRTLLTHLINIKYPYIIDINLKIDKNKCKNRSCSELFEKQFNKEYQNYNFSQELIKRINNKFNIDSTELVQDFMKNFRFES